VARNSSSPQKNPRSPRSVQPTASKSTLQERSNLKPSNSLSARAGPSSSANGTLPDPRQKVMKATPSASTIDDSPFSALPNSSPGKNKRRPLSSAAILGQSFQKLTPCFTVLNFIFSGCKAVNNICRHAGRSRPRRNPTATNARSVPT